MHFRSLALSLCSRSGAVSLSRRGAGALLRGVGLMALSAALFGLSACGASKSGKNDVKSPSGVTTKSGQVVSTRAKKNFESALNQFATQDRAQSWKTASCRSVAKAFLDASDQQQADGGGPLAAAHYNAGLAYMRCGLEKEAIEQYETAQSVDSNFHRARAQIALFQYQKTNDLDGTISKLETIIRDAKFQNTEALVALAALQMERGSEQSDKDGSNDLERAKKNIQRALAIDDSFMPAFNQLALYYLEQAKSKAGASREQRRRGLVVAGAKRLNVNRQQLDLAALVASQAIERSPGYGPIHNTAGLIMVELQDFNAAVKSFRRARQLDPKFFEAHMNYAAVSLSFRGFKEAEKAYRDALKLQPKEYEAHLGLALALRGQINDVNFDKYVAETQKHLDQCKKLDPSRPEAYYNEAILTQEFLAKGDPAKARPALRKASEIYSEFIRRAGGEAVYKEAVKRSQERTQDIQDMLKFIEEGEAAKQQAAREAAAAAKAAGSKN